MDEVKKNTEFREADSGSYEETVELFDWSAGILACNEPKAKMLRVLRDAGLGRGPRGGDPGVIVQGALATCGDEVRVQRKAIVDGDRL